MFYKVTNLMKGQNADYKGLDTSLFVSGSQYYSPDFSYCVLETTEETINTNPDLIVLSETDYQTEVAQIQASITRVTKDTETRIKDLESQNAQMLLTLVNGGLM